MIKAVLVISLLSLIHTGDRRRPAPCNIEASQG